MLRSIYLHNKGSPEGGIDQKVNPPSRRAVVSQSSSQSVEGSLRREPSGCARAEVLSNPVDDKLPFVTGLQPNLVVEARSLNQVGLGSLLENSWNTSGSNCTPRSPGSADGRRSPSSPNERRSSSSASGWIGGLLPLWMSFLIPPVTLRTASGAANAAWVRAIQH